MSQNENENREKQLKHSLLDGYFKFRSPFLAKGYIKENKTTLQIQDELASMMHVAELDIVEYMDDHEYSFITEQDGTVTWAIWRQA